MTEAETGNTEEEFDLITKCTIFSGETGLDGLPPELAEACATTKHYHEVERWTTRNAFIKKWTEWISQEKAEQQQYRCARNLPQ